MDFVKVFDQTVREIKREINLKVLKVPEIEQKVLDATNDEPWGPHGSALLEIAQATKKYTECQMIMDVLWTRLKDSGPNWRHVYKALTVIEYLIANGSEHALDGMLGHTYQISMLSGFEYVEPNGKDSGINVRKKAETIMALLNDKDKIQAVREKAASNRDKYIGLSSTGITNRSSTSSYGSSNSSYQTDRYGSQSGSREYDSFQDSYKDRELYGEKEPKWSHRRKDDKSPPMTKENESSNFKKGTGKHTMTHDSKPSVSSKQWNKPDASSSSKTTIVQSIDNEDDFDPRGTSTAASSNTASNHVDLFGESLMGDLMDVSPSFPTKPTNIETAATSEVDLFADATFQSASPSREATKEIHAQDNIDFFASQPAFPAKFTSNVDFFATAATGVSSEQNAPVTEATNTKGFDPFASVPLTNFDDFDSFGDFASHSNQATGKPTQHSSISSPDSLDETFGVFTSHAGQTNTGTSQHATSINFDVNPSSSTISKPGAKKDTFQVKSGIWADSLSRGLIDLNISAPKKVNLADIGIVGGLDDVSDEKDKVAPSAAFMGRSMGTGSGLGWSGFSSTTGSGGFSAFGQQEFGNFK